MKLLMFIMGLADLYVATTFVSLVFGWTIPVGMYFLSILILFKFLIAPASFGGMTDLIAMITIISSLFISIPLVYLILALLIGYKGLISLI